MNRSDDPTDRKRQPTTTRRKWLRAGLAAGVGSTLMSGMASAAAASYETITVPGGETRNVVVDGNETLENKLYDVTADGAGVTFRLKDNATIRDVGIEGRNQSDKYIFRIGSGIDEVTIERVYTEHYDPNATSIGGILATKHARGTINVRGATIKGFGNNGLYASKCDADLYVEDCYFVNNRTSNFRGGGDYHGNNRDAVFRNCVCCIDDGISNVALYPSGGSRTVGYLARWGTVEVHGCQMWLKDSAPDEDNWYCMRTDGHTGDPTLEVWDSEVSPKSRTDGDVRYVSNVGSDPDDVAPDYAPTSPEDAASGHTADASLDVATRSASDVTDAGATLNGDLASLGGAASVDVAFQYREAGTSTWSATATQTLSSTGTFSETLDGLSVGVTCEFRAVARASDGSTDAGATETFTTQLPNDLRIDGSNLSEQVTYEITVSDAIVKGDYANDNDVIDGSTADGQVWGGIDTYDFSGQIVDVQLSGDVPIYVNGERLDPSEIQYPNDLKVDGSNLSEQVTYEITVSDAIVKGDYANDNDVIDGSTADGQVWGGIDTYDFSGQIVDVQLSGDVPVYVNGERLDPGQFDSAPSVDRYEVTEAGSPNPHANITAEWDVSDADADLATGLVEVIDADGNVLDSAETSISGDVHYGVDYLEVKHVDGQTLTVRVTVTDANGNETTATQSVTE